MFIYLERPIKILTPNILRSISGFMITREIPSRSMADCGPHGKFSNLGNTTCFLDLKICREDHNPKGPIFIFEEIWNHDMIKTILFHDA